MWVCRRSRDRMEVGLTTTYVISAYHYCRCQFESLAWQGVLDTTLCDKSSSVTCGRLVFLQGIPVSSTDKADRHDIHCNWNIVESGVKHDNPNPTELEIYHRYS